MLLNSKKWILPRVQYNSGEILTYILENRGLTVEEIEAFLGSKKDNLLAPDSMRGMKRAVARIKSAIQNKEKILIYGDYDADGITGTSLVYRALKEHFDVDISYYVPNRFDEGYGLNIESIREAHKNNVTLIVTVDTGISAVAEVAEARQLGIDVIITDHHEPPAETPDAYVILNPKYKICDYKDFNLAGVGVAYKLVSAILGESPKKYLDLVALGTVADLVPLLGENRIMVDLGLEVINKSPNIGIKALIEATGLADKTITAGNLGYQIGPRINASGRLGQADISVDLLITDDYNEARQIVERLNEINGLRQELAEKAFLEAKNMIESDPDYLENNPVIILADESWNQGIVGIVASRLVDAYYRPAMLISINGDMGKSSARSISGFNLYEALEACHDILENYGGHSMAVGFTIKVDKIDELRERMNELARKQLKDEDYIKTIDVEIVLNIPEIIKKMSKVFEIEQLAPFGIGNRQPKTMVSGAFLKEIKIIGKEGTHAKFIFSSSGMDLDVVAFNWADKIRPMLDNDIFNEIRFELVGDLVRNDWYQYDRAQLILDDWRISPIQLVDSNTKADILVSIFDKYGLTSTVTMVNNGNTEDIIDQIIEVYNNHSYTNPLVDKHIDIYVSNDLEEIIKNYCRLPSREDFKRVYKIIVEEKNISIDRLTKMCQNFGYSTDYCQNIIKVFSELNFIQVKGSLIEIVNNPDKAKLENSQIFKELHEQALIKMKHITL